MKHGQTHGGKGSVARKVNNEKFAENWDKIFKKKYDKNNELEKPTSSPEVQGL